MENPFNYSQEAFGLFSEHPRYREPRGSCGPPGGRPQDAEGPRQVAGTLISNAHRLAEVFDEVFSRIISPAGSPRLLTSNASKRSPKPMIAGTLAGRQPAAGFGLLLHRAGRLRGVLLCVARIALVAIDPRCRHRGPKRSITFASPSHFIGALMTVQAIAAEILRDRETRIAKPTNAGDKPCFKCGKLFKYRGPRGDNSGQFCSDQCFTGSICPERSRSTHSRSPSGTPWLAAIRATWWRREIIRVSGAGWRLASHGCGRRFQSSGLAHCKPTCRQASAERAEGCRPHGPDQHGRAGAEATLPSAGMHGHDPALVTAGRSANGPNIAIGTPEWPQVASRVISGEIA